MLKTIVIILIIGIAVFVGVVTMQPAEFRVTRGATIVAPVSAVLDNGSNNYSQARSSISGSM